MTEALVVRSVVTPDAVLTGQRVEIDDGVIRAITPTDGPADDVVLVPGYVDVQVNGANDVAVWTATGDDWSTIDRHLLAAGTTTWCPTLVTAPLDDLDRGMTAIRTASRRPEAGRPHIAGVHLEGPYLGGRPGAHRPEHILPPDRTWLDQHLDGLAIVTLAPETEASFDLIDHLAAAGVIVSIGHTSADVESVDRAAAAGARMATHLFNGMGRFSHRSPATAGAVLTNDALTTSVIADGEHVHLRAVDLAFRAKPVDRIVLVSDAVAWRAERADRLGSLTLTDSGAAAQLRDGTLAGSVVGLDRAVANVARHTSAGLVRAVRAASTTPADLLGLSNRGRISIGARADLVALDPDSLRPRQVWMGGVPAR